ncbi:MAG: hypothetical protein ACP5JF_03075 [Candidatus Methanodesulfokora sp.]|jgi:signal transduction histidine kinase
MRFESIIGFLGIMTAIVIGGVVPISIYRTGDLASAIISVIAIAGASLLAIVVVAISLGVHSEIAGRTADEEMARAYIARQKVILEQMDETIKLLKEIRDSLRREVEG